LNPAPGKGIYLTKINLFKKEKKNPGELSLVGNALKRLEITPSDAILTDSSATVTTGSLGS